MTDPRTPENWLSMPILKRKVRSGFIRLGLASSAARKVIEAKSQQRKAKLRVVRSRSAPPPYQRPTTDRMPVPPDPALPDEYASYPDDYIRAAGLIAAEKTKQEVANATQKKVAMLATSNLRIDPRIEREARALAERGFEVVVICPDIASPPLLDGPPLDWGPGVTFDILPANDINFMGWPPYFYSPAMIAATVAHQPFAIHANDLWTAFIGLEAGRQSGAYCVADFHEWSSENVSWNPATEQWCAHDEAMAAAFRELEVLTLRHAAFTITVNDTIARELEKLGGLDEGAVKVVRNIPKLDAVPTRQYRPLKEELGLSSDKFVVLYQGGTGPSRLLEPIIASLAYAREAYLVIRGPSLDMFGKDYRTLAEAIGVSNRVILQDPVPSRDVVAAAKGADLGIWSLPDISKNFRYALPNKVFEYLAAGLPIAVADYPEPRTIVEAHDCGVTFDPYDPQSIGDAINRMQTDPVRRMRCALNASKALKEIDADAEWNRYADLYEELWSRRTKPATERSDQPLRVLHAPCNIGNQPWSLSRAERQLGLRSDLVTNYSTRFNYPADRVLGSIGGRTINHLTARRLAAVSAPHDYDVFHYYFGRSIAFWDDLPDLNTQPYEDLRQAHALGKPIFMTLQGCDARLAEDSNRRNSHTPCAPGKCSAFETCLSTLDKARKQMFEEVLPLCDRTFILNPELGHYVPDSTFMPYANVEIFDFQPQWPTTSGKPKVIHAPSDPNVKGTARILEALERLSKRHDFDLVLIQNLTHEEAMNAYATADIAIDQLLAGWYGGLTVELMALGKPVACYIRESDLQFVPAGMVDDLPVRRIHPETLEKDLDALFEQRDQWADWGKASRSFVERWHDPRRIARWMENNYRFRHNRSEFDPDDFVPPC